MKTFKEIQSKMDEMMDKIEHTEKTINNIPDVTMMCGWLQALMWVCSKEVKK